MAPIDRAVSRRDLLRLALVAGSGLPAVALVAGTSGIAGALPTVTEVPTVADRPKTVPSGRYLDAAVKAARWIRSARVEMPEGLVWIAGPERPEGLSSSPDLYTGGAGVVLFLLDLAAVTGDKTYRDEAEGGADGLLASLPAAFDRERDDAGLYSGLSGVGFTLDRVARTTGKERHRKGAERAAELVRAAARPAGAGVEWGEITDVIGGGAGIGLYLLQRARERGDAAARDLAVRAGRRLIELGIPEAGGRKWRMSPGFAEIMPNFSHGTAGIAYFLATLYRETGGKEFLEAARAGARYLLSIADTRGDACLIFHDEPAGKGLYYLGWCHGPVGTARLFYQLARATGEGEWMGWVKKGARAIEASGIPQKNTPGFWNNVGQCCGSAGVADFFLELHHLTGEPGYLSFARKVAADLLARATPAGDGLKWVQAEHRVRPTYIYAQTGYMQGAAGIGMLLLRLDAMERGKGWSFRLPDSPYA
jgi:lantibiotic modifying enzyme